MFAALLDFLLRLETSFLPVASTSAGVLRAWTHLLHRSLLLLRATENSPCSRVVPRLEPLLALAPRELRLQALKAWPESVVRGEREQGVQERPSRDPRRKPRLEARFSDEDNSDEEETGPAPAVTVELAAIVKPSDSFQQLLQLAEQLAGAGQEQQRQLVEELVSSLPPDLGEEQSLLLAKSLSLGLADDFTGKISLTGVREPVYSLFPRLLPPQEAPSPVLSLLASLSSLEPRLGSLLLHFLTSNEQVSSEAVASVYTDFCSARHLGCEAGLVADMTACQQEDSSLLVHLAPHIYRLLPPALGSVPLLHLLVSSLDSYQVYGLAQQVLCQRLVLLQPSCQPVLRASLSWETLEQLLFWQLYFAHEMPLNTL